ncbi:GUN4 domain-containing protein [Okeania sp. KiyG1]|uniref:GUN4 domain-containing protein n=1 Tax=Okeania sp. KiyG1 TaxID=2720165 RepID=UPI0019237484|nr:GUN4 domain-containing protein [Okeania sp. KiyG1]
MNSIPAKVIGIGDITGFDLAVLQVKYLNNIPPFQLINLSQGKNRKFQIAGNYFYGEEKKRSLQIVDGVLGKTSFLTQNNQKVIAWKLLINEGYRLRQGYSGAPVVDLETGHVLGIATNMEKDGAEGLAISIEALKHIWPEMPLAISKQLQTEAYISTDSKENDTPVQGQDKAVESTPNSIPQLPKELSQEDYIYLNNLLASGRWRQANEITRKIVLKAANGEKEGYLTDKQIQNFPCQVLEIIDRLWVNYSDGHFGFSVQKRIFNECQKEPQAFGDRVGWRVQKLWISASQVVYTPANTPDGHLPWGIMPVLVMDNVALDAFVGGLRTISKTTIREDWQKQLLADFMGFSLSLLGDNFDKEEFKRNLEYELSHDEAWWEKQRLEELKVFKLFSLLTACLKL